VRNPFQTSRPTQLLSSGPPPTSTPRFQRRPGIFARDEIDTSFDEDEDDDDGNNNLALLPSRYTAKSRNFPELIDGYPQEQSPLLHRTSEKGRIGPEDSGSKTEYDITEAQHDLNPATPVAKKRKVFHVPSKKREPITISSSPEIEEQHENEDDLVLVQTLDSPTDKWLSEDDLDEIINSPDPREMTTASRFKDSASYLKATNPTAKSAFRSFPKMSSVPQISHGSDLPDIFSPSKRNGRRDYVPSGNAELVRNWVLDIAAQQSQGSQQRREIVIAKVKPDSTRRFIIVLDTEGCEWLVPGEYRESRSSLQSGLGSICPGMKLVFKSEATRWTVPIVTSTARKEVAVAAHWEVVS